MFSSSFLSRTFRPPPPIFEASDASHKAFQFVACALLRKELLNRLLLKFAFRLIAIGVDGGCGTFGFGGTIGGTFLRRKLEDRLKLEASSAFLSSPPSLSNRPRRIPNPFRTLSGTSAEIMLSDVRLRTDADAHSPSHNSRISFFAAAWAVSEAPPHSTPTNLCSSSTTTKSPTRCRSPSLSSNYSFSTSFHRSSP